MFFFIFFIYYYNKSFRASAIILAMKVVVNSRRLQLQTLLGGVSAETLDVIKDKYWSIPQAVEGHDCKINEIAKERGFKNGDHIKLIARKKVLARSVCEYIR